MIVSTDASGYGLGAALTPINSNGSEVLVLCVFRSLTIAERNYSVGEQEALTGVWSIEKWHTFLWSRKITLRTDYQALLTLLFAKGTGRRHMRISKSHDQLLHCDYIYSEI